MIAFSQSYDLNIYSVIWIRQDLLSPIHRMCRPLMAIHHLGNGHPFCKGRTHAVGMWYMERWATEVLLSRRARISCFVHQPSAFMISPGVNISPMNTHVKQIFLPNLVINCFPVDFDILDLFTGLPWPLYMLLELLLLQGCSLIKCTITLALRNPTMYSELGKEKPTEFPGN